MIRKSRSAWGNSCISESRIRGATLSILSAVERSRAISRMALSLTSGLTMLAIALEREASRVCRWGASALSPSATITISPLSFSPPSVGSL